MNRIKYVTGSISLVSLALVVNADAAEPERPNILLITVDDMNYNSVGVFGCPVKGITPNIDRLAGEGMMFNYAFVQAGASQPSRGVLATGLYGWNSGVEGFNHIAEDAPIISSFEILQDNGYFTGCMAKLPHCFPKRSTVDKLDMAIAAGDLVKGRDPQSYYRKTKEFLTRAKESGKPFFLMSNSQDPHRPFYMSHDEQYGKKGVGYFGDQKSPTPSHVYSSEEIEVPGFLPELPDIRTELGQYYSNVRRADDIVGAVLQALKDTGYEESTLVIFLSDNGMSFPFSKTNCYLNSNKTPFIVKWPGVINPGRVEDEVMISGVDLLPTILDLLSIQAPYKLDGTSFRATLEGKKQLEMNSVYTFFSANSAHKALPMRCVQTREFAYIFSPWSNGQTLFTSETKVGLTYKAMKNAAQTDSVIAERVKLFDYRVLEEFYDLRTDPDALVNLIDDPKYASEIAAMRNMMEAKMRQTNDHALKAFLHRDDPAVLAQYMAERQAVTDTYKKGKH